MKHTDMKLFAKAVLAALVVFCILTVLGLGIGTAMAETAAPVPAAPVDLTNVVISLGRFLLSILLIWLARKVVPPLKQWLEAKTTNEQRAYLYSLIEDAVEAAEQTIGAGKGREKMDHVLATLEMAGLTVDIDMIEAAVKRMNDNLLAGVKETLTGTTPKEE